MELFGTSIANLLPYEGEVIYYGRVLDIIAADTYYSALLSDIEWKNDEAVIFGRHIVTKRKVAWYGDRAFEYEYSNVSRRALPWTKDLIELKELAEQLTSETYNSCLLNLYHSGEEGMAWHSDDERDLKPDGAIASITLGAVRTFSFRHKKTKERISLPLEHGSLLVMKGTTQTHWLHRLPPTKKVRTPRINLTFRTIIE